MLLEIENQFNKLTPDQHKKYIRVWQSDYDLTYMIRECKTY